MNKNFKIIFLLVSLIMCKTFVEADVNFQKEMAYKFPNENENLIKEYKEALILISKAKSAKELKELSKYPYVFETLKIIKKILIFTGCAVTGMAVCGVAANILAAQINKKYRTGAVIEPTKKELAQWSHDGYRPSNEGLALYRSGSNKFIILEAGSLLGLFVGSGFGVYLTIE